MSKNEKEQTPVRKPTRKDLAKKIKSEFQSFITAKLMSSLVDPLVEASTFAYEIILKTKIHELFQMEQLLISDSTLRTLIGQENTLDYIFAFAPAENQMFEEKLIELVEQLNNSD